MRMWFYNNSTSHVVWHGAIDVHAGAYMNLDQTQTIMEALIKANGTGNGDVPTLTPEDLAQVNGFADSIMDQHLSSIVANVSQDLALGVEPMEATMTAGRNLLALLEHDTSSHPLAISSPHHGRKLLWWSWFNTLLAVVAVVALVVVVAAVAAPAAVVAAAAYVGTSVSISSVITTATAIGLTAAMVNNVAIGVAFSDTQLAVQGAGELCMSLRTK